MTTMETTQRLLTSIYIIGPIEKRGAKITGNNRIPMQHPTKPTNWFKRGRNELLEFSEPSII